jgi:hypothetical protein
MYRGCEIVMKESNKLSIPKYYPVSFSFFLVVAIAVMAILVLKNISSRNKDVRRGRETVSLMGRYVSDDEV